MLLSLPRPFFFPLLVCCTPKIPNDLTCPCMQIWMCQMRLNGHGKGSNDGMNKVWMAIHAMHAYGIGPYGINILTINDCKAFGDNHMNF